MRNDDLLLLVGKLNYAWTNTESLLIYVISHLAETSKEVSIIIFLTLNTFRARIDLIERLCKRDSTPAEVRERVLDLTARLKRASRLRNKYNHCIYSFDENGMMESTQLLRIADYADELRYGKVERIDDGEMDRIRSTIGEITEINRKAWEFLGSRPSAA